MYLYTHMHVYAYWHTLVYLWIYGVSEEFEELAGMWNPISMQVFLCIFSFGSFEDIKTTWTPVIGVNIHSMDHGYRKCDPSSERVLRWTCVAKFIASFECRAVRARQNCSANEGCKRSRCGSGLVVDILIQKWNQKGNSGRFFSGTWDFEWILRFQILRKPHLVENLDRPCRSVAGFLRSGVCPGPQRSQLRFRGLGLGWAPGHPWTKGVSPKAPWSGAVMPQTSQPLSDSVNPNPWGHLRTPPKCPPSTDLQHNFPVKGGDRHSIQTATQAAGLASWQESRQRGGEALCCTIWTCELWMSMENRKSPTGTNDIIAPRTSGCCWACNAVAFLMPTWPQVATEVFQWLQTQKDL